MGHNQAAGEKPARIQTGPSFYRSLSSDVESAPTACDTSTPASTRSLTWVSRRAGTWLRSTRVRIRWHLERTWGLTSHTTIREASSDSPAPLSTSSTSSVSTLVETLYARHHHTTNHNDTYSPEDKEYANQRTKGSGWPPAPVKVFSSWTRPAWWRRQWRTVRKWVWIVSLMLILVLGTYVVIMTLWQGLCTILVYKRPAQEDGHEQHFSGATDGGHIPDLIDFKNHKPPHAPQGGHANKGGSGDNSAQVPLSSPGASSDTTKTWLQLGEPMDIYSDENEDEAAESTSFVTWLTHAFTPFMEQSRIKNKGESPQHGTPSAPSGQETTHEPVRYFTYQPFAGFSNQFYCMLRAMHIAKRLNRTLLIPPITSSSHDVSRRNQAWSDFFDLDEFQAKTGLKVIEYHDLRDKGGFRGPTGVRESGTSLGGYWVPPHLIADPNNDKRYGRPLKTPPKRTSLQEKQMHSERYQHSFGTGTGSIDMSFPCHVTCGFGTKRSLDYTAKGFMRQWGFEFKKLTLPTIVMSENATDNANLPETLRTKALPMDQTRDYDRIIQALEHETLRDEPFLCVTNTYKIHMPRRPEDVGIGSFEFTDFGQFLKFQPKVMQVVDEYLEKVLGKAPESRASYPKDTFWIPLSPPPPPAPADNQPMDPVAPPPFPVPAQQSPQEPSTDSDANQGPSVVVSARQEPLIKHTYFMLHIRRGDFEKYCKDKVDVLKQAQCLPTNDRYVEIVRELQKRNRNETVNGGNAARIPVFVATNESSPEKLQELRELGLQSLPGDEDGEEWRVINHTELQTVARLGPYGPVILDQVLMAEAEAVLGVKLSTFSRVAEYRQRDWYGRRIMYV